MHWAAKIDRLDAALADSYLIDVDLLKFDRHFKAFRKLLHFHKGGIHAIIH